MVYLDLLFNLSLLVALSVVSVFIEQRWPHHDRRGVFLQGALFGAVAVIGMLRPLTLGPGLIFDGRSVMVSLCALFYGPLAAAVAVLMTMACRLAIGGPGMVMGLLVIVSSAGIGLVGRRFLSPWKEAPSVGELYMVGLAVHLAMVALMFTLPGEAAWATIRRVGLPVLILYPLATILAGKILSDQVQAVHTREALRDTEERFRSIVEGAPDPIFIQSDGRFAYLNPAAVRLLGAPSPEALIGTPVLDRVHPDFHQAVHQRLHRLNEARRPVNRALAQPFIRLDGSPVWVETVGQPIVYDGKEGALVFVRDISERKEAEDRQEKLQAQLLQAQKMEAVGRLAGGVAHDFNNMLSVILGYSEMALDRLDPQAPFHAEFTEIHKAAERSAAITRQLLAFARQQTITPVVLDLNNTVAGMLNMLRRLIGEDIDLVWKPGASLGPVKMDPGQIDQILANLVVNARDAIAGVGKVTIETENVFFDAVYCAEHAGFIPGRFVMLAVSDNGCGMTPHTMAKLFEPFFTTKEKGRGTGLGLATVYGIVKQNNGFINVYSEPGNGTTIKIYLPRHERASGEETAEEAQAPSLDRHGTVMVVEDEAAIRQLAEKMLEALGLAVIVAGTPRQAIDTAERYNGRIDLLLTDVVMPEMNGRDLAAEIRSLYPELKVLFMSGYTANVIAHHGVLDEGVHFIQKPFSKQELADGIRRALGPGEAAIT